MKFHFKTILAVLAVTAVAAGCQKTTPGPKTPGSPERKTVTVTATIPEDGLATKVSLTQDETLVDGKLKGPVKLAWVDGDTIDINGTTFTVVTATISGGSASFTGDEPVPDANGKYTISYTNLPGGFAQQTQDGNGTTDHLQYGVTIAGASEYKDFTFSQAWASGHSATISQSSVLRLRAKLPADEAAKVRKVLFSSDQNIFAGGKELTVEINTPGEGTETDFVTVYATLPGAVTIPADAELWIRFQIGANDYQKYTHYRTFPAATEIPEGKVFGLDLNCVNVDRFANASTTGIGTSANPYLIGDQNQVAAINSLAAGGQTTYFKMIDDVDMTGKTHNHINTNSGYTQAVNFDGNNKTISKLGKDFFYVFKGSIHDLTLDQADVTSRGIFAEYCQGTGHTISNITVSNGKVASSSSNVGALIGQINNGSGTVATITDCTVSNTNVTGAGVVGGVIGFADQLISMSGCTYSGGKVTASARYAGGLIASTSNYTSSISDCHVENATIESSVDRVGGFAGLLHTNVQVKGCTVGTSAQMVIVNSTRTAATANVGGFVGVNYGRITKNGDVRNKAYVTIKSSNATTGNAMNIGGFAGYNTGTIEYSDAEVTMTGLVGQYIGGFCGILLQSGKIENSTETGSVTGNNYTGGFVGVIDSATTSITGCSSAGSVSAASSIGGFAGGCTATNKPGTFIGNSSSTSVTSSGSNFGGFIGNCVGTFTSNYATGNVASTGGGNGGGFAGGVWEGSTGSVFSKNYATGNVSGNANIGGLIGYVGGNLTMSNCYATGNVGNSTKYNQKYGGLVGFISDNADLITEGVTISNCYATGDIEPSFAGGGLIGRIGLANISVSNCAAWNMKVYPHSSGSANWSSAAVVGVTFPICTLTNNYRNPDMNLTAYWVPADMSTFQHPDVSSTHPLTDSTGAEMTDTSTASGQAHYPQYPYHGKVESGKTLSQLASSTLGWSGDVWDFSGPLPLLK